MCKARAHIYAGDDENIISKTLGKHNHSATAARVEAKLELHQMKEKSVYTQDVPRTILYKETTNMNGCALLELPSISSISHSIRHWRQVEDSSPPIPQERHGYSIPDQYCSTDSCFKFLQFDSGEHDTERIFLFATDSGIDDIKRAKNRTADGTFKCSPTIHYQLYTLHIQDNDISVQRMFTLLPDKTQTTFHRLFAKLKELLHNAEPNTMMIVFEKAAIKSFSDTFPNVDVMCCNENGMPHTNNYIEGFHNALRTLVSNVHPNIWTLITALKKKRLSVQQKLPISTVETP